MNQYFPSDNGTRNVSKRHLWLTHTSRMCISGSSHPSVVTILAHSCDLLSGYLPNIVVTPNSQASSVQMSSACFVLILSSPMNGLDLSTTPRHRDFAPLYEHYGHFRTSLENSKNLYVRNFKTIRRKGNQYWRIKYFQQ